MRATRLVCRSLHQLKGSDSEVRSRSWIGNAARIGSQVKAQSKKCKYRLFPEAVHLYLGHQRQVVQLLCLDQGDRAADRIRTKSHISVSKQEPFAARCFISALQCVRLSQPAGRQVPNIHNFQPRVAPRGITQYFLCVIGRTVVRRQNFERRIVNLPQRFQCLRQFSSSSRAAKRMVTGGQSPSSAASKSFAREASRAERQRANRAQSENCDNPEENSPIILMN